MSVGSIIYTILISPLQIFFEFIFTFAEKFTNNPGYSIIVLSLAMNFLVLPLYKRADAMQAEERDTEAKLHDGLAHIKKVFSGDEKMMIQQEYYRQNHYRPANAFKGSISLFLEIPFFIAAYQFLSHLQALQGVSFGPITDLGTPDGLLLIGGLTINLLPIIMTAVNLVSCVIYTKGFPLKTKIQLYAMAIFFLFFLYSSPAGLLFYWTLNNVFSLLKNVFYKLKNPKKVLAIMSSIVGMLLVAFTWIFSSYSMRYKLVLSVIGVLLQIPLFVQVFKKKGTSLKAKETMQPSVKMFILSAILLSVILGTLIPSSVISSSPEEFINLYDYRNPLWYIVSAFSLSFGTCLIWFGVFYWLADTKGKVLFEKIMWVLCGASIMNYMFFGTNFGTLSSSLKYNAGFEVTTTETLANFALIVMLCIVMAVTFDRYRKFSAGALATGIIAISCMSASNIFKINSAISPLKETAQNISENTPQFNLSKTGKNVIVFMLDRSMGTYVPYLFNEKPELTEKFAGFTYYSNTMSFGGHTNFGSPALFGGYEYTPEEMNKRSDEYLVTKHDEALRVLPVLFDENGYDVTVCDAPWTFYKWIFDPSVYEDHPNIKGYNTVGKFSSDSTITKVNFENNCRNFFCYSLMKASPISLQKIIYNDGNYFKPVRKQVTVTDDLKDSDMIVTEMDQTFMDNYNVLTNLPKMTKVTDNSQNTFLMMDNDTTHSDTILKEPEYIPANNINNNEYDAEHMDRFTVNGRTMHMDTSALDYSSYEINMAALIQMGNWFDYLRENDVYDNTRIILVADHGNPQGQFDELMLHNSDESVEDLEAYFPLLMVKDFNSQEFSTSDEFMTNGDVPTIATQDVIKDPTNPFTGNKITSDAKNNQKQYVISSQNWSIDVNNGKQFMPADWYSVHDNIWDLQNWKRESVNSTSPNN